MMCTGIVVTYNEDQHLEECLTSLSFCNEILVFDMGSNDRSVAIAQKLAGKVSTIPQVDIVEKIWGELVKKASNDWIILQDPDEVFPAGLVPLLNDVITNHSDLALISIPWKFFFKGKPLSGTVWGGEKYKSKLFHRQRIFLDTKVHNRIQTLHGFSSFKINNVSDIYIKHYWVDSIVQMFKKHWRYIRHEGESRYKQGQRFRWGSWVRKTARALLDNLFKYEGMKGGLVEIFLSFFYAWYVSMSLLSLWHYEHVVEKRNAFPHAK